MTANLNPTELKDKKVQVKYQGGSSDTVYAIGIFGAWAFYIGRAKDFREGALGFLKGLFWPAFLVYEVLEFLHKE
jgi:hypothetical protein